MAFGASPVASTIFQLPSGGGTGSSNANGGSDINSAGANLLIALISWDGSYGGTFGLSDNLGNSSWQHGTKYGAGVTGSATQIWYHENPTVGSSHHITITTSGSGMFATCEFMAWAGALTSSAFDVESGDGRNLGSAMSSGNITPSVNGELIVTTWAPADATGGASVATGFSSPAGAYINTLGNAYGGFSAYQVQTTAASIGATWQLGTGSGTNNRAVSIGSFKPSAGGGATYTLALGQGSYTLTGEALAFKAARKLALGQGSYALAGEALGFKVGRKLALGQGSYALTGQSLALKAARKLALGQGSYVLTGQDIDLVYTPVSGATYTLALGHGSYVLTGQALAFRAARKLALGTGSYVLTGEAVTLTYHPFVPTFPLSSFQLRSKAGEITLRIAGPQMTLRTKQ